MAKPIYEVIKCKVGEENLLNALNAIGEEKEVVSVLPDHGGRFANAGNSGAIVGYMIVVRPSRERSA